MATILAMRARWLLVIGLFAATFGVLQACGNRPDDRTVRVAVAANFVDALEAIAARFEAGGGAPVAISAASTGKLYAQVVNGAPFDVLLAADRARPMRLVAEGLAVDGSQFTYAVGRLALCFAPGRYWDTDLVDFDTLRTDSVRHVAIAHPKAAPYGTAAMEVLDALGIRELVEPKLVVGENVGQAMHFVDSGGAEAGLVALSQVVRRQRVQYRPVRGDLHEPIRQDAVLLARAADRADAQAFLAFLRGPQAREVLLEFGYDPAPD